MQPSPKIRKTAGRDMGYDKRRLHLTLFLCIALLPSTFTQDLINSKKANRSFRFIETQSQLYRSILASLTASIFFQKKLPVSTGTSENDQDAQSLFTIYHTIGTVVNTTEARHRCEYTTIGADSNSNVSRCPLAGAYI